MMVDKGDQTPRGLCVSPERYADVKRKLKAVRAAHQRVRERLRKFEEPRTDNGENRFTDDLK